ncbi:Uncharacterized metal-binding protein YceD, DUF177 family [Devosia enhydra]|uniref:Uncharacterized metal-binding protein YceD, DUF177 family n=1 Tax=Devosia enhydra TaxID=665118 RepID=A0A1K2HTC1_9HYPH|nr:DUF177 domain-containing protein [Devosia enhydra]SFZ81355.1 Uncharacterized metal-binding protein YceD, DUF177 family [Devosia enhydra]
MSPPSDLPVEDPAILISDASLRIDSMPPDGRALELSVSADERAAIAESLSITALDALAVTLKATRFRGGLRITGKLFARLEQPCVVTLEPVHQTVEEPVDRIFLPVPQKRRDPEAEVFVDVEGEDAPDYFEGHEVDLSALIIETLSLGIDPYPRAQGADTAVVLPRTDDVETSPFARLKALKDQDS